MRAGGGGAQNAALVPPDAGGEDGEFGEDFGVGEAEVERDQAAERGAAERGIGGVGQRAELAIDAGLQLLDEQTAIEIAVAAAKAGVAGGGVFGHAAEPVLLTPTRMTGSIRPSRVRQSAVAWACQVW